MSEAPRYPTIGTPQTIILDNGQNPVGYKVAVCLIKGEIRHVECADIVVGATKVAELAAGGGDDFAAWVHARIVENDLVGKANTALDAL